MKLHLRNGLRTRQRMHIIASTACACVAASLFVIISATESDESLAGSDNALMSVENTYPLNNKDLAFISTASGPFNDDITIEFHSASARPVELKMVSIAGKDIAQRKLFAKEGLNRFIWRYNDDYKGICYLYICSDEKSSEVIKVVRN